MLNDLRLDTLPYWTDSASLPHFPRLDRDEEVDVLIVGGGITGLTAAYLLTAAGRTVAVLERGRCAGVDSGHTSAHLTMVTDLPLTDLVARFGRDRGRAVWDAGLAALAQIAAAVRDQRIACEFARVDGYKHAPIAAPVNGERKAFAAEAKLAAELGFDAELVDDVPFVGGPGIRFPDQARFHPRKYLAGLAHAVTDRGGLIFEHTIADEFSEAPLSVTANGHTITCDYVVLATHTPLMGSGGLLGAGRFHGKLALYTSYVIAGRVARNHFPDALLWDTATPYHYLRIEPQRDHDLVIFGGEDHKTGQVVDVTVCFDRLERTLRSMNGDVDITHRWSGQVIETSDGLPYIGETADRQFAGTGFGGNGLTFGTLTGMIAADRILGRKNPWRALFDPTRTTMLGATGDDVRGTADYASSYMLRDRFRATRASSPQSRVIEH